MKKINLKGISETLSEKELKNVMGGSGRLCNWGEVCDGSRTCWSEETGDGYCKESGNGDGNCACK